MQFNIKELITENEKLSKRLQRANEMVKIAMAALVPLSYPHKKPCKCQICEAIESIYKLKRML